MTIRVRIEEDIMADGIRVLIRDDHGQVISIIGPGGESHFQAMKGDPISTQQELPVFARIRDDIGMALRDALIVHYGGMPETQKLRADYDAERARVDKLTESMMRIAMKDIPGRIFES